MSGAPWLVRWTTERDDRMRALAAEGLSCAKIAAQLGGTTHCAVIGRMGRIGVKSQNPPYNKGHAPRRSAASKHRDRGATQRIKAQAGSAAHIAYPVPPNASLDAFNAAIPAKQRKTIAELTETTCRWPLWADNERDGFYCGDPSADRTVGRPYCAYHSLAATRKSDGAKPWLAGRP